MDDRERANGRLALRWTPTAETEATLRYAQQRWDDGAAQWGSIAAPRATVNSGTDSWNRSRGQTLSLDVSHRFASGLRLRSIAARNVFDDRVLQDTDFQRADLLHVRRDYRLATTSQELRLEGEAAGLWNARWLAGLYLDRDDHDLRYEQKLPAALMRPTAGLKGSTAALFTHWTVPLSERWTLAAGARASATAWNWPRGRGGAQRRLVALEPQALAAIPVVAPGPGLHQPQRGLPRGRLQRVLSGHGLCGLRARDRARLGDRHQGPAAGAAPALCGLGLHPAGARHAGAADGPAGRGLHHQCGAGALQGADFELGYVFGGGWQLQTALGLNRTRFGSFRDGAAVYDGHRNPFAPDMTAHVALRYDAPGRWWAQAAVQGTGKVYLDAANAYRRPGYGLLNLSAGYAQASWEIAAYLRNAANRRYDAVGYLNGQVVVYSPPREFGVRLTWRM